VRIAERKLQSGLSELCQLTGSAGHKNTILRCWKEGTAALGGLMVRVLATGYSVAGSSPTEDGGFLWVIKIPSAHFLRRGSKAVGPMS
jgi:hypothetical protein